MTEKGNRTEELALTEPVSVGKSESIADLVRRMLQLIGEDPEPRRLAAHSRAF